VFLRRRFFVVTGEETVFPEFRSTTIADITDGIENTVLVIEVSGSRIPWTQPIDIPFAELRMLYDGRHRFSLNTHSRGPGLLFADMERFHMVKKPPFDAFASLFTKSGSEIWTRKQLIAEGYLVPMSISNIGPAVSD
jgi:hypothetical protein